MIEEARSLARQHLPASVRQVLGSWFGPFDQRVLQRLSGLIFDLRGGCYRTDGCQFSIPRNLTSLGYRSCFLRDTYEKEERELIKNLVRSNDSVLEFGACLGVVSCVTNKLLADKTKHVVVEANPLVIPSLYRNRELNQAGFLVEHCAISNRS